jgi:hypothetical protein
MKEHKTGGQTSVSRRDFLRLTKQLAEGLMLFPLLRPFDLDELSS